MSNDAYSPEAIWNEMQDAYYDAGGSELWPGDEKEMHLRAVLAVVVQMRANMAEQLSQATLAGATGANLDIQGDNWGVARLQATTAGGQARLTFESGGASYSVPAGVRFTPDGIRFYATTAAINGTGGAATVSIVSTDAGSQYNGVTVGTRLTAVDPVVYLTQAVVTAETGGGTDAETDEAYRARIRASHGLYSVAGPSKAYEAITASVDTRIREAKAVRGANPPDVNVALLFHAGVDADQKSQVITAALAALSPDDVRPLNDNVQVTEAQTVRYEAAGTYTLPSTADATAIQAAIADFIQWQEGAIGRAIVPNALTARMYQAGATNVRMDASSNIEGEPWAYTEIPATAVARGTVTMNPV